MKLEMHQTKTPASVFDIPLSWMPVISPLTYRTQIAKRYGRPGSVLVGDQEENERSISINYKQARENDVDYKQIINTFASFMRKENGPHYLYDTDNDIRTKVALRTMSDNPLSQGLELRIGANSINLIMLDAFWEDIDFIDLLPAPITNNEVIQVPNPGEFITWPFISITTNAQCDQFTLENLLNGGAITLTTNGFGITNTFYIDCINGTVFLDDFELSAAVADGSGFLFLDPGPNPIKLINPSLSYLTIRTKFRKRAPF